MKLFFLKNPLILMGSGNNSDSQLDPQNPNRRGTHGGDKDKDELKSIFKMFNEKWFHGWEATPEEQRIKFINIAQKVKEHPDYQEKYSGNPDTHTRNLAFEKIIEQVIDRQRKNELDLYRLYSKDEGFKRAMQNTVKRILENPIT